ncbi:Putative uncharacterized protein [Halomonas sp. R57-5]|nr:Putative uncharacterized protein [Halomonas sp. R57-5]
MVKDIAPNITRYRFDKSLFISVVYSDLSPEIIRNTADMTGNSETYPGKFHSLGKNMPTLKSTRTPSKERAEACFLLRFI